MLYWPGDFSHGKPKLWTILSSSESDLIYNKLDRSFIFNSNICSLYFIFNHDFLNNPVILVPSDASGSDAARPSHPQRASKRSRKNSAIENFEKNFILIKDRDVERIVGLAVSNPPDGVDNWPDIVITTLHHLELYEKNEKKRVAIKKALVYAIDAKNWKKNAEEKIKSPEDQFLAGVAFATGGLGKNNIKPRGFERCAIFKKT